MRKCLEMDVICVSVWRVGRVTGVEGNLNRLAACSLQLAACRAKDQLHLRGFPRRICNAVFGYGTVLVPFICRKLVNEAVGKILKRSLASLLLFWQVQISINLPVREKKT